MTYRVDLTERAVRSLRRVYVTSNAADTTKARTWFNGLESAVLRLNEHPVQGAATPENARLRHLLYGRKPHVYALIYAIDEVSRIVTVLHIRHGVRAAFPVDDSNDD